ncbi:MAG TPA: branched-chain amino acid ABC transporter permease [Usitatibacter sp.]|nr:branched-chain amino acid ABC transporter permease [Usitatibacter sp.]
MRARTAGIVAALVILLLVPFAGGRFAVDFATKTMLYAIIALSLELLVGQVGLVCFGQAAFFGVAAYATVLLTPASGPASVWWLLPACLAVTGLFAAAVGALSIRTRGVYFIMVTLAFSQMAYYVAHDTPLGGGSDGIYLTTVPSTVIAGLPLVDLGRAVPFYYATLAFLAAAFVLLAVLLRSRFGRALAGIRVNEQRMRAAGFSTYPYKLAAFVVSAMVAGVAGFLFAVKDGFVNPELLGWHVSGTVLMMVILGGVGHLHGAIVGAFAFALLQEFFMSEAIFGSFAKHWHLGVGLSIILCVALMPRGLAGAATQLATDGHG